MTRWGLRTLRRSAKTARLRCGAGELKTVASACTGNRQAAGGKFARASEHRRRNIETVTCPGDPVFAREQMSMPQRSRCRELAGLIARSIRMSSTGASTDPAPAVVEPSGHLHRSIGNLVGVAFVNGKGRSQRLRAIHAEHTCSDAAERNRSTAHARFASAVLRRARGRCPRRRIRTIEIECGRCDLVASAAPVDRFQPSGRADRMTGCGFVEVTATPPSVPATDLIAASSPLSPTGVEVACALRCWTSSGEMPACRKASSIARRAPSPSSGPAVI